MTLQNIIRGLPNWTTKTAAELRGDLLASVVGSDSQLYTYAGIILKLGDTAGLGLRATLRTLAQPGNPSQLPTELFEALDFAHARLEGPGLDFVITTASDGAFYATGSKFSVVVTAGTVDGQSVVGETLREFSLGLGNKDANVTQISGDSVAADNAEAFFDGTGYAGTGNTIPTVSTVNALASNSVNAAALASDAVAEIQSGLATSAALATVDGIVDAILVDTDTTIPGLLGDIPTVAEFNARTIPSADYFVVGDYTVPPTTTQIRDAITSWQPSWAGGSDFSTVLKSLYDETFVTQAMIVAIETDTQNIQSRIPAALVSGRMDASVGSY